MPEITEQEVNSVQRFPQRERAVTYVETHFRAPELARFLAWIRQGPGNTFTWGGERWERALTPRQHLAMATCKELDLKVLQQNPATGTQWARLAREGHEVWQVMLNRRYLGVIVDGVYRSYEEIKRRPRETASQPTH